MTNHAPEFAGKKFQANTKVIVKLEDEDVDMAKDVKKSAKMNANM